MPGTSRARVAAAVLAPVLWMGCVERTPTSLDDALLPDEPVTVEVFVPWADFGSDLVVFGGFGAPIELGLGVVAHEFGGSLEARTLVRHAGYPTSASVRDTAGTVRTDEDLTFVGGRVVARFDTVASTNDGSVVLVLGGTQVAWDARTASWANAVDSFNVTSPWPEAGGGPATVLDTATWDPAEGDSAWFEVDSATVAAWADTADHSRGVRLEVLTPDVRLELRALDLQLVTRPSLNPDTLLHLSVPRAALTFIYDPVPQPPPDGIRVGGAPSWRTVMDIAMPGSLVGPQELCDAVGCPVALDPGRVNYASLVLTSRQSPSAFEPSDSVLLDLRPVLARDACPKCPLGGVVSTTRRLAASVFGSAGGSKVEIPVTAFAHDLLRGETASGGVPPSSLALLSTFEPLSISFASFHGPGSPEEPVLRLLVTVGGPVELP